MDLTSPTASAPRRPYRKPEVVRYPLRPEEAVLANCKISGTSGPGAVGSCTSPVTGPCSVQTS